MIIEVRTRTVGYKAGVKNSLSFSTLPTKPFPRLKDPELQAEAQTAWEPVHDRGATALHRKPAALLWSNSPPPPPRGFSDVGNGTFLFQSQGTRVINIKCIDLRVETTK